jgi:hypothetical protein
VRGVNEVLDAIDKAMQEAKALRRTLKKRTTVQVRAQEERAVAKATALAWFNHHRPVIEPNVQQGALADANSLFREILDSSEKSAARATYDKCIKQISKELLEVRAHALLPRQTTVSTTDVPPDFSILARDRNMQEVLVRRWKECCRCLDGKAALAGTVMMGGLLEALLLARVNREMDKSKIFQAKTAPKDGQTGTPLQLKSWTLRHYIGVAHELGWISQSAKDVGVVLRDYRNYVHPYKEHSHGVALTMSDAALFWEITKRITRQLLS